MSVLNAFTVDLEDWYQGLEIDYTSWQNYENRIEKSTHTLLELLDKFGVKATFFVLGYIAEQHPQLIRKIASQGHEIGSHGFSHRFIYNLSPSQFREELQRSRKILEELSNQKVVSFRAPFFSITKSSIWALSVIRE